MSPDQPLTRVRISRLRSWDMDGRDKEVLGRVAMDREQYLPAWQRVRCTLCNASAVLTLDPWTLYLMGTTDRVRFLRRRAWENLRDARLAKPMRCTCSFTGFAPDVEEERDAEIHQLTLIDPEGAFKTGVEREVIAFVDDLDINGVRPSLGATVVVRGVLQSDPRTAGIFVRAKSLDIVNPGPRNESLTAEDTAALIHRRFSALAQPRGGRYVHHLIRTALAHPLVGAAEGGVGPTLEELGAVYRGLPGYHPHRSSAWPRIIKAARRNVERFNETLIGFGLRLRPASGGSLVVEALPEFVEVRRVLLDIGIRSEVGDVGKVGG